MSGIYWKRLRPEKQALEPPPNVRSLRLRFTTICPAACLAAHPAAAQLASEAYQREAAADWEAAADYWSAAAGRVELDVQSKNPPAPLRR
jgi:hypothetical protein